MKKSLNVGMIGYKFMGKAHANAWRQAPYFFDLPASPVLKTVCGRDASAVAEAAGALGFENVATDWREVVNDPTIDIVDIVTGNDTHSEIAIAAIKAGKAVLCEKPLAMDTSQAREMRDAASASGLVNMVCHNYRRIPAIVLAKKMIDQGRLGRIFHYRARYMQDWIVDPEFPLVWRLQSKFAGSGTHGDINAHIIDLGRYLAGEISEVCGLMETFIKQRPIPNGSGGLSAGSSLASAELGDVTVDDAVLTIGRFESGALLNLEATRFALGRKNGIQLEINGSKGSISFDFEDMNRLKFYDDSDPDGLKGFRDILVTEACHDYAGAWWPPGHIIGYEHTFTHTIADFVRAVHAGVAVQPTFEDGYRNQVVLDSISRSSEERKWVDVVF